MSSRTSLTRYAPLMRDVDEDGPHKLAARMWHERGDVALMRASLEKMSWEDRAFCEALASRLYGRRKDV